MLAPSSSENEESENEKDTSQPNNEDSDNDRDNSDDGDASDASLDDKESNTSKGEESDQERTQIRGELSAMSFEDLMKLKEELGSKVYNEAVFGSTTRKTKPKKTDYKRANKNRPREMSAKRQVPLLCVDERRSKIEKTVRDPRFDEKCGEYNTKLFKENYSFINDIREKEVVDLKKKLESTKDPEEKTNIKFLIQRLENQNREEKRRKLKEEVLKEEKEEIDTAKREGKQPRYRTKKERKARELVKQYVELKKSGKLAKHLEKRRKKNAAKDRKKFSFD